MGAVKMTCGRRARADGERASECDRRALAGWLVLALSPRNDSGETGPSPVMALQHVPGPRPCRLSLPSPM